MKERKGIYKDISKKKIKEKRHRTPSLRLVCVEDPLTQSSNTAEFKITGSVCVVGASAIGKVLSRNLSNICILLPCSYMFITIQWVVFSFNLKKKKGHFIDDSILVFSQILK